MTTSDKSRRRLVFLVASVAWSAVVTLGGCAVTTAPTVTTDDVGAAGPVRTAAFSAVVVAAPLDVTLVAGEEYAVLVSGGAEASSVRIAASDEVLSLHVDEDLSARPVVEVSLPADALVSLRVGEAAVVSTSDALEGAHLEVPVSGGSSAELDTDGLERVAGAARDGSTVTMTGTSQADSLEAAASGASSLHLFELSALDAVAEAAQRSDVEVTATRSIDARASELSIVTYRGSPADVTQDAVELSTITSR